ncbi:mCG1028158, partial [Mus musculus]
WKCLPPCLPLEDGLYPPNGKPKKPLKLLLVRNQIPMTTNSNNSEGRVYVQKALRDSYSCQDIVQFQQTHVGPESTGSLPLLLLKL